MNESDDMEMERNNIRRAISEALAAEQNRSADEIGNSLIKSGIIDKKGRVIDRRRTAARPARRRSRR
jgi:hypothetical protein